MNDTDAGASRKNILTDMICFIVLSPLVYLSSILCIKMAIGFLYYYKSEGLDEPKLDVGIILLSLSSILLLAYSTWILLIVIFHRRSFCLWQKTHMDLQVQDQLSHEESLLFNNFLTSD